jgi:uncharacterized membrane protein HdeD (DUF308 family)
MATAHGRVGCAQACRAEPFGLSLVIIPPSDQNCLEVPMTDHISAGPLPAEQAVLDRLAPRWKTLVALGVLMLILSLVALAMLATATLASVLIIGTFMALTGIVEIGIAFQTRSWSRFFVWMIAGFFYLAAGFIAIAQPIFAASAFTLILGAGLAATGFLRIVLGISLSGNRPRGLVLLTGAITLLLGLVIVLGWPGNSAIVLGALLSADLLFYGLGWIAFGLALRSHGRAT